MYLSLAPFRCRFVPFIPRWLRSFGALRFLQRRFPMGSSVGQVQRHGWFMRSLKLDGLNIRQSWSYIKINIRLIQSKIEHRSKIWWWVVKLRSFLHFFIVFSVVLWLVLQLFGSCCFVCLRAGLAHELRISVNAVAEAFVASALFWGPAARTRRATENFGEGNYVY